MSVACKSEISLRIRVITKAARCRAFRRCGSKYLLGRRHPGTERLFPSIACTSSFRTGTTTVFFVFLSTRQSIRLLAACDRKANTPPFSASTGLICLAGNVAALAKAHHYFQAARAQMQGTAKNPHTGASVFSPLLVFLFVCALIGSNRAVHFKHACALS